MEIRLAILDDVDGLDSLAKKGLEGGFWKYTASRYYDPSARDRLKSKILDNSRIVFVALIDDMIAGNIMLEPGKDRCSHKVEFGFGVDPEFSGRGIGTELVKTAMIHCKKEGFVKAEAEVAEVNIPSIRVLEKNGFKLEGVKVKGFRTDEGEFVNLLVMGKVLD